MKITFHGATQTVTGSQHEVQAGGKRLLLDCGLFQGPRQLARQINTSFDFPAKTIDAVILSHSHLDHCGNLPNLVKQGFTGPIYATKATAAIAALMLLDSAKIQEEDAAYLNQKSVRSWKDPIAPLYTTEDAQRTIRLFKPLEYRQPLALGAATVEFHDAGHILGSAAVSLTESANGASRRLVFSGDVGRPHSPVLQDPDPFTQADAFITECTYGGRTHTPIAQVPAQLVGIIRAAVARGGWLIMPAFALGRTQALLQQLHELRDSGQIPQWLPIYVDSPLASRVTEVFRQFPNLWDEETKHLATPFDFPNVTYVASPDESRTLNNRPGPGIIMAASGMCEAGRILHHLKHHVRDPKTTILLPGFQAQYTLGRKIQDRLPEVPILGDMIPLRAHVESMDGLSAHADGPELLAYTRPLLASHPRIFLVHGEPDALAAHQAALTTAGFAKPTIATRGLTVEI